jgi:hypothetical protein
MSSDLYLDEEGSPVDANSLRRAELEARIKKYADNCYCVALRNPDHPAESVRCQNCLVRFQLEEHYQRRFDGKRPASGSHKESRRGAIELLEFVSVPTVILFFYRGLTIHGAYDFAATLLVGVAVGAALWLVYRGLS